MRPLNTIRRATQALGVLAVLALMAWPALAEDRPETHPGQPVPEDIPQISQDIPDNLKRPEATGTMSVRELTPVDTTDRGGVYVDAGEDRAYPGANPLELSKLEAARVAVEASRAAGTLNATPPLALQLPDDPEQFKLDQLRQQVPAELTGPDGSGVVDAPPARQEVGSEGLNAHEQAKLDGDPQGSPRRTEPEAAESAKSDGPAEAPGQREGGR